MTKRESGKGSGMASGGASGDAVELHDVTGSEEAFTRFLAEAKALDKRDMVAFRADAAIAYQNVKRGLTALEAVAAEIAVALPKVNMRELRESPDVAQAVQFAVQQVAPSAGTDTAALIKRCYELRETMLASALALGKAKLLDMKAVKKIQAGSGKLDAANDCVDLSALFRKHAAAIKGKHPVTASDIREAADVGSTLQTILRKKGAPRKKDAQLAATAETRDRMWTLLVHRHEAMRRAGFFLFGEAAIDDHVPALQSRAPHKRKSAAPNADKSAGGPSKLAAAG